MFFFFINNSNNKFVCSFGEEIRLPLTSQLAGVGASRSGHFPFCAVGPFSFLCLAAFVL